MDKDVAVVDAEQEEATVPEETGADVGQEQEGAETDAAEQEAEKSEEEKAAAKAAEEKRIADSEAAKIRRAEQRETQRERERRIAAEAEARVLRELHAGKIPANAQAAEDAKPVRPRMDNFDTREEYEAAMDKYDEDFAGWTIRKVSKTLPKENAQAEAQRKFQERRTDLVSKVKEKYGEEAVETITDDSFPITPAMRDAVFESEHGHEVLGFLSQNPELAKRISGMSAVQQVKEIDKIERQLLEAAKKTQTKAPQPANTLKGGAPLKDDESKMSDDEYLKKVKTWK